MGRPRRDADDRFRTLFEQNSRSLLLYCLRRVSQPVDAADVVAETFVVAWRRIDDLPTGPEARLWLFGVARRQLSNQRRGQLRRSQLVERLRHRLGDMDVPDVSVAVNDAHDIAGAMKHLDDDDRELLRLTAWEGLSPTEVSVVLDVPAATARSRLYRARAHLRRELESMNWTGERSGDAGHASDDGRALVQDLERER